MTDDKPSVIACNGIVFLILQLQIAGCVGIPLQDIISK